MRRNEEVKYVNKIRGSCLDLESTSFGEFTFTSGGFGEDVFTVVACNDRLGVTEDDWGLVASSALDVHEVAVGSGNESFEFMGLSFLIEGWVEDISFHCCGQKYYYLI